MADTFTLQEITRTKSYGDQPPYYSRTGWEVRYRALNGKERSCGHIHTDVDKARLCAERRMAELVAARALYESWKENRNAE